ncbi:hypothetical protein EJB05_00496, partial [Eragrostis curvula]
MAFLQDISTAKLFERKNEFSYYHHFRLSESKRTPRTASEQSADELVVDGLGPHAAGRPALLLLGPPAVAPPAVEVLHELHPRPPLHLHRRLRRAPRRPLLLVLEQRVLEALQLQLQPPGLLRHLAHALQDLALAPAAEVHVAVAGGGGELLRLLQELAVGVDQLGDGVLGVDHLRLDGLQLGVGGGLHAGPQLLDDGPEVPQTLCLRREPVDDLLLPLPVRLRRRDDGLREELLLVDAEVLHHHRLRGAPLLHLVHHRHRRLALRRPQVDVVAVTATAHPADAPQRKHLVVGVRRRGLLPLTVRGGSPAGSLDEVQLDIFHYPLVVRVTGVAVQDLLELQNLNLLSCILEATVEVQPFLLKDDSSSELQLSCAPPPEAGPPCAELLLPAGLSASVQNGTESCRSCHFEFFGDI